MAKKKLYFVWMKHSIKFLDGAFAKDFDGYVRVFKSYPRDWQKAVFNFYSNNILY